MNVYMFFLSYPMATWLRAMVLCLASLKYLFLRSQVFGLRNQQMDAEYLMLTTYLGLTLIFLPLGECVCIVLSAGGGLADDIRSFYHASIVFTRGRWLTGVTGGMWGFRTVGWVWL